MRALIPLLVGLLLPASASAAPLGEVAPLALRGDGDCVAATGTPGELATHAAEGVRFLSATRSGLALGPFVGFTGSSTCPAVATRASGAGVIVGQTGADLSARVRDPGGTWGAPVQIAKGDDEWFTVDVLAAVSDRGDVIVAWKEAQIGSGKSLSRLRVARRLAGAAFTPAESLGAPSELTGGVVPAISSTGEAFVLTTAIANRRPPFRLPVSVAIAPPGGPFGAPAHI